MLKLIRRLLAGPPAYRTPEEIVAEVVAHLETIPSIARHAVRADDPLTFDLWHDGEDAPGAQINLHNLVQHVLTGGLSAAEQRRQVAIGLRSHAMMFDRPIIVVADLRPMVRHAEYVRAIGEGPDGPRAVSFPVCGDLHAMLMIETEVTFSSVNTEMLEESGLTAEKAWAEARANVRRLLDTLVVEEIAPGFLTLHLPEAPFMAGTLLLFPERIDALLSARNQTQGLVGAPNRHTLFLVNPDLREALERAVAAEQATDHPQSACIFRRISGSEGFEEVARWDGDAFVPARAV